MAFLLAFGAALGITLLLELIRFIRHRLSPTAEAVEAVEATVEEAADLLAESRTESRAESGQP
jgi:hypothetical protein